jgi:heat shock protein HslJ
MYLSSLGADQWMFDYVVEGMTLTLTAPNATWVFEWVPPTPDAELVGTAWVLNEMIDPSGYSHTSGMDAGTLRLDPDGTVTGSTSCRELAATWTADGDGVQFDDLVVTGECTPQLAEVDVQVVQVLGGPVSVHIDADHLVLMSPDGTGIGFRAG